MPAVIEGASCAWRMGAVAAIAAAVLLATGTAEAVDAEHYHMVASFTDATGGAPIGPLAVAPGHMLLGTVSSGTEGSPNGAVVKFDDTGALTVVHAFAADLSEGCIPSGRLQAAAGGWFYGTTQGCGDRPGGSEGTVYRVKTDGRFEVLHRFGKPGDQGYRAPTGGVALGPDGNFYGLVSPKHTDASAPYGAVFRMSPAGLVTIVHEFTGDFDPRPPFGAAVFGADGRLYGNSMAGGLPTSFGGTGSVWVLGLDGSFQAHGFAQSGAEGCNPEGDLSLGVDRHIYGTTTKCGSYGGGRVFQLTPALDVVPVHDFGFMDPVEGSVVVAGVTQGADGRLVGATAYGGANNEGTLFSIGTDGSVQILHDFGASLADGFWMDQVVTMLPAGRVAGVTHLGGSAAAGSIFMLQPAP